MLVFLESLSDSAQLFNLFRYLTFRTGAAILTAMLFVFLFGPWIIRSLRERAPRSRPSSTPAPRACACASWCPRCASATRVVSNRKVSE